ncbi:MAG: uncharacterized membrane protein YebE (DUF533 family) [Candidatus Azotimanducaceae bacterium]|jgi:uncharacterized membrane protein YebE (DUF533 family)
MPIEQMIKGISGSSALTGLLGGAAGGALVSAFTNKKTAGNLLKAGGLVAAGGLAWKAYQTYRSDTPTQSEQPPVIARQEFVEAIESTESHQIIIKAMIAAAHADGHLTDQEKEKIWKSAIDAGATSSDLALLAEEIAQPWSIADLAANTKTMESRIDVYAVSQLVIDDSCVPGQTYLAQLSEALALPKPLVDALRNQTSEIALAG